MLDEEQAKQSKGKGADAATAAEAALRIAFDKGNSDGSIRSPRGSSRGPTPTAPLSIQKDYAVLVGNFQAAEILTALKTFGIVPWSAGKPGLFPSPSTAQVYINSPQENVLVLSSDSAWVSGAAALQKNATGLMAKSSDFASSVSSMGGRSPDAMIFIKGALGQRLVASDPMAGMLLGPFTKAKGTVLSLHAADIPTAEPHTAFENEQMAGFAQTFLQQAIMLGRAQVEGAIKETADPVELKDLNSTLEMISSLSPKWSAVPPSSACQSTSARTRRSSSSNSSTASVPRCRANSRFPRAFPAACDLV